jgi:hypothetical protein
VRPSGRGRTPRLERWTNHASTFVLGLTGIALFAFRYLMDPPADDPFAVASHPLEPASLAVHVIAAPFGVLGAGMLVRGHVLARLQDRTLRRSRATGWALALTAAPMILSGYLLQVSVSEGLRRAWLVIHLVTGAAWLVGWLLHLVSARRALAT